MLAHSWLSPKCFVGDSPLGGRGLFTRDAIDSGELVVVWGGQILTDTEVQSLAQTWPRLNHHTICIAPGLRLAPVDPAQVCDTDLINHCCEPNLGLMGQIVLVARRAIAAGEELTFDYETSETEQTPFDCCCGAARCRGRIDGQGWRNASFREAHAGYLSWNVLETMRLETLGKHPGNIPETFQRVPRVGLMPKPGGAMGESVRESGRRLDADLADVVELLRPTHCEN